MDYNSQIYIELLKKSIYFKKQGTTLEDQNYTRYRQLLKYQVKLNDYIHWKKKSEYLNLLKLFVDSKIDGSTFENRYCEIFESTERIFENLEEDFISLASVQPNPKSFGFTEWISELLVCCDEFYPNFTEQDRVGFAFAKSEDDLRAAVANIIPEMEKYLDD